MMYAVCVMNSTKDILSKQGREFFFFSLVVFLFIAKF